MKKGVLFILAALIVAAVILYFTSRKSSDGVPAASPTPEVASTDLPPLPLTKLDGSQVMARNLKGKTVLVLFQPDCDHCQREAVAIRKNLEAFKGYAIYFVSDAAIPQLAHFAEYFLLADKENVYFATTPFQSILNTLGPVEAPSIYIYSESGRLVKSFNGETPIEDIIQQL